MPSSVIMPPDAWDKLQAGINCAWNQSEESTEKEYLEECARWWSGLTQVQQEISVAMVDAYRLARFAAVANLAEKLPVAPQAHQKPSEKPPDAEL